MEIDPNGPPPLSRAWYVQSAAGALRSCFDPQRLHQMLHVEGFPMFRETARLMFKVDADTHFTDDEIRWMYDSLRYQFAAQSLTHRSIAS